ncbi:SDR family oxidoreductase [Shewanella algidipiscicola]|uniref:NAD(P)-dependent oxidoreductase n=1 Tax=Shewanella algidipiscicola TaxID=614070 RepID=A0ABQ4PN96_9GAMM|nr:SDR family oxidoreductase [Shewanella algidipiscicola]GIU49743.1 NAD(P)-dependent oxidoreductase [Shewanella algidipiscicola]
MIHSVAVVGCGWFGLPLAKALVEKGLLVSGSKRDTTQASALKEQGIDGFVLDLDAPQPFDGEQLAKLHADAIVINIPPGLRRGDSGYLVRLERLQTLMGKHAYQRIIFISTTGVYPANGKVQHEADATAYNDTSKILLQAEAMFKGAVIVRFAGLMGPKRHPGRFLAGKTGLTGAMLSVNMTHLDDCVGGVMTLLTHQGQLAPAYNICSPEHPNKAAFYQRAAAILGVAEPEFASSGDKAEDKVVDGSLICRQLGYQYQHYDPFEMLKFC